MQDYYFPRLRDLREDKDKTQEQVAKIIGTSQSYYAQYENGKRAIPFDRIVKLAKYYKVSIDYIAGLTNNKGGIGAEKATKYNIQQNASKISNKFEE